jgi:ferritin-like metal-binding protein YciE
MSQLDARKELVVKHLEEAYAMEQQVERMLDSLIRTTAHPELKQDFEKHRAETEQHAQRLKERLDMYGEGPSRLKDAGGMMAALMKGVADAARSENDARNVRDAYTTEHMEIASYQLLERVAKAAGDVETAEVARRNRDEEQRVANKIDLIWDQVAERALEQADVA